MMGRKKKQGNVVALPMPSHLRLQTLRQKTGLDFVNYPESLVQNRHELDWSLYQQEPLRKSS